MLNTSVTLTHAQILALKGTYIQVVPAPGANKLLSYIYSVWKTNNGWVAYTGIAAAPAGILAVVFDSGWSYDASVYLNANQFLGATGKQLSVVQGAEKLQSGQTNILSVEMASDAVNDGLYIALNNGASTLAGGNAGNAMTVTVYYNIEDAT